MDSKDFSAHLQKFSNALIIALPVINEKVAVNAYALMRDRKVNEGTIGDNKPMGQYSTNEVPLFFKIGGKTVAPFSSGALTAGGDELRNKVAKENAKRRKKGEEERGISYKQWREANNRPTKFVTGSFSGATDNDIGVIKSQKEGTKIVTIVGPKNTKEHAGGKTTSEIVKHLKQMYGEWGVNKKEETLLKEFFTGEVDKVIKQNL